MPLHAAQAIEFEDVFDDAEPKVGRRELNVLILEDDSTDLLIAHRMLQRMETYRVRAKHACDLASAREILSAESFDLALVDFCLGVESGAQAIQDLGGRLGSTPVVLLTAMPGQEIYQHALRAGAIHCLSKNQLNPVVLETTIRSALHTHALETKLQQMIVELENANKAKTDFFTRISHDLKTPLNAILGYSEMIALQTFGPTATQKYSDCARNIQIAGTHLLEVLNNLIQHAASQSTYAEGPFEPLRITELVQRAVDMIDILLHSRGHELRLSLPEDGPVVSCRPSVLTQAIINVLSNAVKYTAPGGKIDVTVRQQGHSVDIEVADNGIGMSQADMEIALSPFGRVQLPAQSAQDGTGIGLPITRDILRAHGGDLALKSEPGRGTVVTLTLPEVAIEPHAIAV